MQEIYKESSNRTPIIFILSPGADPMSQMMRLAEERQFEDKLDVISLGKG